MRYLTPTAKRGFQEIHDLSDLSPHKAEIVEGVAHMRDAYATHGIRGAHTRMTGFDEKMMHQKVASIDPSVFFSLEAFDNDHGNGDIFRNREKFYAWLNTYGKEFDTRRKVD